MFKNRKITIDERQSATVDTGKKEKILKKSKTILTNETLSKIIVSKIPNLC